MAVNPLQQMIPQVLQQLMQNPQMLQQIMQMAGNPQTQGVLMQLASSMMPNAMGQSNGREINPYEQMPHPNLFYNFGQPPRNEPYHPDYQRGIIQEVAPPMDWLDPEMEIIERRRAYTPPRARDLQRMPSEPIDTMDEDREPIDLEDMLPPIEQGT